MYLLHCTCTLCFNSYELLLSASNHIQNPIYKIILFLLINFVMIKYLFQYKSYTSNVKDKSNNARSARRFYLDLLNRRWATFISESLWWKDVLRIEFSSVTKFWRVEILTSMENVLHVTCTSFLTGTREARLISRYRNPPMYNA